MGVIIVALAQQLCLDEASSTSESHSPQRGAPWMPVTFHSSWVLQPSADLPCGAPAPHWPIPHYHLSGKCSVKGRSLSSRTGLTECLSSSDSLAQSCLAAPSITKASIALCRWDGRLQVFLGNCWLSPTTSLVLLPLRPYPFDPKKLDSAQTVPRISQSPSFSWQLHCFRAPVKADELFLV